MFLLVVIAKLDGRFRAVERPNRSAMNYISCGTNASEQMCVELDTGQKKKGRTKAQWKIKITLLSVVPNFRHQRSRSFAQGVM